MRKVLGFLEGAAKSMFCYQIGTRRLLQRIPCWLLLLTLLCRSYLESSRAAGLKGAGQAEKKRKLLVIPNIGFRVFVKLVGLNQEEDGALPEVLLPEAA